MVKRIGFILGSLRQESNSQKVAAAVKALFPEEVVITEIPIGDLPLYNPDLDEGNVPESYTRFRQAVKEQDGIVFITPEYNRGLPAAIKNAIDVGSRPIGQGVLAQPEAYLAQADQLFDEQGQLSNEGTKGFLQTVVDAYLGFAKRF